MNRLHLPTIIFLGLTILLCLTLPPAGMAAGPFSKTDPLTLHAVTPNESSLPQYRTLELVLDLKASYENPFDPAQVDVYALFSAPDGKMVRINGFLYQAETRRLDGSSEKIEPAGEPVWKIRFTPTVTGEWSYQVFAKDRSGEVQLSKAKLMVTQGAARGFIRRSAANPRAFAWDDGKPFFATGENVCWGGGRGSFDYDGWLPELAKAGGNFIRIWMCSWNCALEWSAGSRGEH